jgi:plasmid stabilization system protein ParE
VAEPRLTIRPLAVRDTESAFDWYESQRPGLGERFIIELAATYERIRSGPLRYQELRAGVRHARLRTFRYAVYYLTEDDQIVVLAVVHPSRDPSEWQSRL